MKKIKCPLNLSQTGVFLECMEKPDSTFYNIPFYLKLPADIDIQKLKDSISKVISIHPSFNVNVKIFDDKPYMIESQNNVNVIEKEIENIDDEIRNFVQPFDLENDPLYRFEICHYKDCTYLFFEGHHVIFDGSSISLIFHQIIETYIGKEPENEKTSLFDICESEQNIKETEKYKAALEYFKKEFDGIETDSKPQSDCITRDVMAGSDSIQCVSDSFFSRDEIEKYVSEVGISENTLFMTAFAYALSKINGTSESVFNIASSGRYKKNLELTTGMFVKTIPVGFDFDETSEISSFLVEAQRNFYQSLKHDCISFGDLAVECDINNDISFVFQSDLFSSIPLNEYNCDVVYVPVLDSPFAIHFVVLKNHDKYEILLQYLKNMYTQSFAEYFINLYLNVVREMISKKSFREIQLVDKKTKELLDDLNKNECDWHEGSTVIELFRKQAEKTPDNICLVYKDKHFTYREIDNTTDRLAHYLISQGIEKDKVVGILVPRCEFMLICALGVLKAGGAYMPLDPSYPPERLNLMIADSGAAMLITMPQFNDIIAPSYSGLRMMTDQIESLPDKDSKLPLPSPDDLFILLYTSGSTGRLKGVMYTHSNALVSSEYFRTHFELDENSNNACYASYGFDACSMEMYPTVISGAALHIIPEEIRLELLSLREYFNANKITHCILTTQVCRQFAVLGGLTSLKHLSAAGEKLTPLEIPTDFKMYNLYGSTEGSCITSGFTIDKYYTDIPIGKAVDNLKIYVVDKFGRLLPPYAVGELWITGPHVTKGYLNMPEKTKEVYGNNPFLEDKAYSRSYHTGDIVRLLPDGNMQFIGRRDAQVKIRGFRIELTEIEEVIRRFPDIKDATAAAFDSPSGGKYAVAYIVSDKEISEEKLCDFIRSEKPPYMVPSVIMQIDAIPLTQNQKVNRRALPVPQRKNDSIIPPETPVQKKLFDIIADCVGHREFGIATDIYSAGLTSIGALKLNTVISKEFGIAVRISDIKQNSTIKLLEKFLSANNSNIEEFALQTDYPLTQTQLGIFVECISNPNTTIYNMPMLFKLSKKIKPSRLAEAVKSTIDAHPYIKTQLFTNESGDVRAKRMDDLQPVADIIYCSKLPEPSQMVKPFKILGSPLYYAAVYITSDGCYLFLDICHIINDGISSRILLNCISRAYLGEKIETESFSGFEAALEEQKIRSSEAYSKAKDYYDKLLSGCDTDCMPSKSAFEDSCGTGSLIINSSLKFSDIQEYCENTQITFNSFFNGVFGFVLGSFIAKNEFIYTTLYSGRSDSRLSDTVSMLVKTIPVSVCIDNNEKICDYLKKIQKQLADSMANDIFSFAEISRTYNVKSDILFIYQGEEFNFDTVCGEEAEIIPFKAETAKVPLTINVYVKNNKLEMNAEFKQEWFSENFIENLLNAVLSAAADFICKDYVKDISMMSDFAWSQYSALNATKFPFEEIPVHQYLERQAAENPDKCAVIANGEKMSFSELDSAANRLADSLIKLGVKSDEIVGLILDRTKEVMITEFGILKSGGAFLPLLPSYPFERVDFCLKNADCRYVITTEAVLAEHSDIFHTDELYDILTVEQLIRDGNDINHKLEISLDSIAYCIYTSGSTGTPKGVMISHHNFSNFIATHYDHINYFTDDNCTGSALSISSICFDMSIDEMYRSVCAGKTLCIASENEIHNPTLLYTLMTSNKVQFLVCTPSFLTNLLSFPEFVPAIMGLKSVIVGAEAFPAPLYDSLKKISPSLQIINGYGPTECTMCCSVKNLTDNKNITIGKPTGNIKMYVVDSLCRILPPYAEGEMIICGDCVGKGYIKLPEKNKASFFTLRDLPAYHSGDLVRINSKSEIEFLGRVDNQVKIRGYRVELDEIENVMRSFEGIMQSKVIVRNNGSEDYLAAFFTAEQQVNMDILTEYLKSKLTYYMVPAAIMQLDEMPLTSNGKIDKSGLPEIKSSKRKNSKRIPKKSLEERICEIFKSVLSIEECFADDNFFELGGTSLSASKVTMKLMSENIKVEYGDIFSHPTPESLAKFIEINSNSVPSVNEAVAEAYTGNPALQYNTCKYANQVKRESIGNVLLTGAAGFLGIHILRELIDRNEGHIYCLIRKGSFTDAMKRLKMLLMYYFDDTFDDVINERISIINADITDENLNEILADVTFDTVINSVACVKHFVSDDILERVNVGGVENLISVCKKRDIRLIQISSVSVCGVYRVGLYENPPRMYENDLFMLDSMDNKYVLSKYHAEQKVFDAVRKGLRGKVIRVGNLMGRYSDGEFQINADTNMFLSGIRGFAAMGMYPISHMTDHMNFSPVDCTAKAIVTLAGTNDMFTAFNADSRYGFDEMKLIDACNSCGIKIVPTEDAEYYNEYHKALGDSELNSLLNGLAAYDRSDMHIVETDNGFTTNILYRLGFSWPLVNDAYLESVIDSFKTLGYFDTKHWKR